ncbi:MAG: hypothetical protein HZC45_04335 [Deltaproteobacteria bacterium]|nr:hypothetical protein [Deltaproteobacteria bacterium]
MKKILITLSLVALIIVPLSAYACSMGQGQMMDIGASPWFQQGITLTLKNAENLELDERQKNKLEGIRDKYTKDIIKIDAELKTNDIDLNNLLKMDNIDLLKVKNTVKKIEAIESQIRYLRIEAFTEARKVLNPEQKGKLKKLMEMPYGQIKGGMGQGMDSSMMKDEMTDCPMMKGMMGGSGMMGQGMMGGMDKGMDCPMMKGGMGEMMGGGMGGGTAGEQTAKTEVAASTKQT